LIFQGNKSQELGKVPSGPGRKRKIKKKMKKKK